MEGSQAISISPLLEKLSLISKGAKVDASEIAAAISLILSGRVSPVQIGSLLTWLSATGLDFEPNVLSKSAEAMRQLASPVNYDALGQVMTRRKISEGSYQGGLCDIVGTGGDGHSTFNVSTTSSIIASSLILVAKHGNRASTSKSGSSDVLNAMAPTPPNLEAVTGTSISEVYEKGNYAFLLAPGFHRGMKNAAPVRKELGFRTIFNLLGPLSNPVDSMIEARLVGVARKDICPIFAEAFQLGGAKKALVVCGDEDLDELSCAGITHCWQLLHGKIEHFKLQPSDFGLPTHKLSEISPGMSPAENAAILLGLLENKADYQGILHFVLMNTAALLVIAGVCDAETSNMGHGDDGKVIKERGPGGGRWKEGVRRAQWAIESGQALRSWQTFVEISNSIKTR